MNNGKLMPMWVKGTEFLDEEYCSATSSSNRNGFGCTNKALTESEYWKNLP